MSRPARLPSAYTLFSRLLALRDRITGLFHTPSRSERSRVRLSAEPLEDRSLPGVLSGHVFIDANANGAYDAGEAGVVGASVYAVADAGVSGTMTTDTSGQYTSLDYPYFPTNVTVTLTSGIPAGYQLTTPNPVVVAWTPTGARVDFGVRPITVSTTTTLSSSGTSTYGQSVSFTATVTSSSGTPTGTVTFMDGSTSLGTATLSGGVASVSTSTLSAGTHSITAVYGGDATHTGSTSGSVSQVVNPKALTVSGVSANNKVYDATTTATLNTAGASLSGIVSGDTVTLNASGAAGTFANKNAGTGISVTASGFALSGAQAGNYTLTQPSGLTANITPAALTVSGVTAADKVYDGTTAATLSGTGTLLGVYGGDTVSVNNPGSGTFAQSNVGTGIAVTLSTGFTLSGAEAGNYTLTQPTGLTANITAKALTVSGVTADDKAYDGTTTATLSTSGATLTGIVSGDAVSLSGAGATGTFASKDVSTGISVTASGFTLSGAQAGNYTLTQPTGLTASITQAALTVTPTSQNRAYGFGGTSAALGTTGFSVSGTLYGSDAVSGVTLSTTAALSGSGNYNAGAHTLNASAATGSGLGNYAITYAPLANGLVVTPKALTATGLSASNKTYDATTTATLTGTATLSGLVSGDTVSLGGTPTGAFADANAGTNKPVTLSGNTLSGTDAGNYTFVPPTLAASINKKSLDVTGITVSNKTYDGNTTATVNATNAALSGVIIVDPVALNTSSVAGTFSDKNVGTNKSVTITGLSLSGSNAGNYSLNSVAATAGITAKSLSVTGITADDKVYDGNTSATVHAGNAALSGVVSGDTVNLDTGNVSGAFDDPNPGLDKNVNISGLTISGTDAGNYSLVQPTTVAFITTIVVGVTKLTDATEGGTDGVFRFTRTGSTSESLTVSFTVSGTAGENRDYDPLPRTVMFLAGAAEVELPFVARTDDTAEGTETAVVTISAGSGYLPQTGLATAALAILDSTPLTISAMPSRSSLEGDTVGFGVPVNNWAGGTLVYSATGLPMGVNINAQTGWVSGMVGYGTASSTPYSVTITATAGPTTASRSFTWTVGRIALDPIADQENRPGDVVEVNPYLANPSGGPVAFTVTGLPAGLEYDPATGSITGTIGSAAAAASPYSVTVTATAGTFSVSQTFEWIVADILVDDPGDQVNTIWDDVELTMSGSAGESTITWSAVGLPAGLTINAETGVISGTVSESAASATPYAVTVTATAGTASASVTFDWTIGSLTLENPGDQTTTVGAEVRLPVFGADPSGESLTWSATGLPPGLSIDPDTGEISGTVSTGATAGSPYHVTVTATVDERTESVEFDWTVEPFSLGTPATQSNAPGDTVSLALVVTLPTGATPTFDADGLPPGLSIDTSAGVISGTVASGAGTGSPFRVTVLATVNGVTLARAFDWYVSNGGVTLTNPGDRTDPVGATVAFAVTGSSLDGSSVEYSADGLPDGVSIDWSTGALTGQISGTADGIYSVTIWAETDTGYTGSVQFTWTVTAVDLAPRVESPGNQTNLPGAEAWVAVFGEDPNGDELTWSAVGLPAGLTINAQTGVISGTISESAASATPYAVTVTATAGTASASVTFDWRVQSVVLTTPGDQESAEGDVVSLFLSAEAADPVTYSATNLPPGLTLDVNTGEISGTVADLAANSSPYIVTVTATAGGYSDSRAFTWVVTHIRVDNPGPQSNTQGDSVFLPLTGFDPDEDTLTWSATGLPTGLAIDAVTGQITGTIAETAARTAPYTVTVTATDPTGHQGSVSFEWSVNGVRLDTIAPQLSLVGDVVSLALEADGGGSTLTWSATGLPTGLAIDAVTGQITGTIAETAARTAPYTVTVTVGNGTQSASASFAWTVRDLIITGPTAVDRIEGIFGSETITIRTDAPAGTTIQYSASGLPAGLSINPDTGVVSGTPNPGAGRAEPYRVTLVVTVGGQQVTAVADWTVAVLTLRNPGTQATAIDQAVVLSLAVAPAGLTGVTYTAENLPPGLDIDPNSGVISGAITDNAPFGTVYSVTVTATAGAATASATFDWRVRGFTLSNPGPQQGREGDAVTLALSVNAPASVTLTWGARGLPDGLTINTATGVISGTIAALASNTGVYTVSVSATDGTDTQYAVFTWTVGYLSLSNPGDQTTVVGQAVSVSTASDDTSPGTPTYSAAGLPNGLTINSTTGLISGTVSAAAGSYAVTVSATADGRTAQVQFTWTVVNVSLAELSNQYSVAGSAVSVSLVAVTAPGVTVSYTAVGLPSGLTVANGVITGTIAATAAQPTPYRVTVTAEAGGSSASRSFDWYVTDNQITVTSPGNQSTRIGASVGLQITATGPEGKTLKFEAIGLPSGLLINPDSGWVGGTVGSDVTPGAYPVTVWVKTTDGLSGTATFTWTVTPANKPPVITAIGDQVIRDFTPVTIEVPATDEDGDTLSYKVEGLPYGLTIDSTTGVITGKHLSPLFAPPYAASYSVTVTANDGQASASTTFTLTVRRLDLPVLPNQRNAEGDEVNLQITAQASEGAVLVYSATGLPPGLTMNSTGLVSGTVSALASNHEGPYHVQVTVTDRGLSVSREFDWSIWYVSLTNPGTQRTVAGQAASLTLAGASPAGPVTYSITGLPPGLTYQPTTGVISGTVDGTAAQSTPYHVTATATAAGRTAKVEFDWFVDSVAAIAPATQYNMVGDSVNLQLTARTAPGVVPTYTVTGLPPGATANSAGLITGTLTAPAVPAPSTKYTVTVTVTPPGGTATAPVSFDWYVGAGNVTVTAPANQTSAVETAINLPVTATGTGIGTLRYSASGLPAGLSQNSTTGVITGTIGPRTAGQYSVRLLVEDGAGSGTATFTWTVTGADRPPILVNPGDQTSRVGGTVSVSPYAFDPDGDAITFTVTGLPAGLTLDSTTGKISGAATTATTEPATVTLTATANGKNTPVTFQWTVRPDGSETGTGLLGMYYDTDALTDFKFGRVDAGVSFNWGKLSPDAGIDPDTFSIRWVGQVEAPVSKDITFTVKGDNGARLWVGDLNQTLIDAWGALGAEGSSKQITLQAGQKYDIVLAYKEVDGDAAVSLRWSWEGHAEEVIPASRLYAASVALSPEKSAYDEGEPVTLIGTFAGGSGNNQTVVVDWGDGSPAQVVAATGNSFKVTRPGGFLDDGRSVGKDGKLIAGNGSASDPTQVRVIVTDKAAPAWTLEGATTVTVNNVAPVGVEVRAIQPPQGGSNTVTIQALVDDPGASDWVTLKVDWGDGSKFNGSPFQTITLGPDDRLTKIKHEYQGLNPDQAAGNKTFTITVTANDDDELNKTKSGTTSVDVWFEPPELKFELSGGQPGPSFDKGSIKIEEGYSSVSLKGEILRPGKAEWKTVGIDWDGDGTTDKVADVVQDESGRLTFSAIHTYPNNKRDAEGKYNPNNILPFTVKATAAATGYESNKIYSTGSVYVQNVAPSDLEIRFGGDNDDFGTEGKGEIAGNTNDAKGRTVRIAGSFRDPATSDDTYVVEVYWGDEEGGPAQRFENVSWPNFGSTQQISHTYTTEPPGSGGYTILVRVFDNDEPTQAAEQRVSFTPVFQGQIFQNFLQVAKQVNDSSTLSGAVFRFVGEAWTEVVNLTKQKAKAFVDEVGGFLNQLNVMEKQLGELFGTNLPRLLDAVLEDPVTFISRLMDVAAGGFRKFIDNLGPNVQEIILQWFAGKLGAAGITINDIPTADQWKQPDWPVIGGFVLKVLGLTWDDLLTKVTSRVGEDNLAAAMKVYDLVKEFVADGRDGQAGIFKALSWDNISKWFAANDFNDLEFSEEKIRELISAAFDGEKLQKDAVEAAKQAAVQVLPGLILKTIAPLVSPVSAGFKALVTLSDVAGWLVKNIGKVNEVFGVANALAKEVETLRKPGPAYEALKNGVAEEVEKAIKKVGPVVIDFLASATGADGLVNAVTGAVKKILDKINEPIDKALDKVIGAGKKILDKALGRIVPNGASSPDYKGVISGADGIVKLPGTDETHQFFLRFNSGTQDVEVVTASLPIKITDLLATWKTNWKSDQNVVKKIDALEKALKALDPQATRVKTEQIALAKLAKTQNPTEAQKKELKAALKKYAEAVNAYIGSIKDKKGAPLGAALRAKELFDLTNGEWAPGHFMSALRALEEIQKLLPKYKLTLTNTARDNLLAVIRNEGKYGGWGDEVSLVRDIVARAAAQNTPLATAIKLEAKEYFGHTWIEPRREALDGQISSKPTGAATWYDYIATINAPSGRDVRGKTLADTLAEYNVLKAANANWPIGKMHGHHIVYKSGFGRGAQGEPGKQALKEARDLLIYYGIDPYFGKENLAYAPNYTDQDFLDLKNQIPVDMATGGHGHPDAAAINMRDRLMARFGQPGVDKSTIAKLLKDFAQEYIDRRLPGMK